MPNSRWRIVAWAVAVWGWITHADTVIGLAQTFWGSKLILGALGGIGGGLTAGFSGATPIAVFIWVLMSIGGGLFIGNELISGRVMRRLSKLRELQQVEGLDEAQPAVEAAAGAARAEPDWHQLWVDEVDRLFTSEIYAITFAHLWTNAGDPNPEPRLLFTFVVANNTPFSVLLTGVQGQATINDDLCTMDARWDMGGSRSPPFHRARTTISQPMQSERGKALLRQIEAGETIRMSLGAIRYIGTNETLGEELRRIAVAPTTFDVELVGIKHTGIPVVTISGPVLNRD